MRAVISHRNNLQNKPKCLCMGIKEAYAIMELKIYACYSENNKFQRNI